MRQLRVKELLKERGISLGKFSRGADIPLNTVRRIVKDPNYNPTAATLMKAAGYLGVPIDYLFTDEESPGS